MLIDVACHGSDVTVDTNVLAHASNSANSNSSACLEVIGWLRSSSGDARIVLDDNGKAAPDLSTSVLYKEYSERLPPQSVGQILVTHLLLNGRYYFAARPDRATMTVLRRLVARNTSDCAIAGAACGSSSRFLVSNDFQDFTPLVRSRLRASLGLEVVSSLEAIA